MPAALGAAPRFLILPAQIRVPSCVADLGFSPDQDESLRLKRQRTAFMNPPLDLLPDRARLARCSLAAPLQLKLRVLHAALSSTGLASGLPVSSLPTQSKCQAVDTVAVIAKV